ncbi:hypothetical protein BRD03_10055 [Halobacteriales archaeon QS_9_68_17]|nr:MAG: hypothetical protein BRD03_10055 [Halobacteriales archaeon QS_9_68_17]
MYQEWESNCSTSISARRRTKVDVPVRILVGDEDRGVSVEDCRRIAGAVDDGDVTVIPGENHSFNENRTAVVEQTLRYLSTES